MTLIRKVVLWNKKVRTTFQEGVLGKGIEDFTCYGKSK
jgi:hypothetical protein